MAETQNNGQTLEVTEGEKYRAVEELIKRSTPNAVYYSLLVFSSLIIGCGILLDNMAILIGGMLVAPVLTPALTMALGISIGDTKLIGKEFGLLVRSFAVVAMAAAIMTLIFGGPEEFFIAENSLRAASLYFVVAVASGMGATFALARKEVSEALPGIAIAVSLVPPVSIAGASLMTASFAVTRFYFLVFSLNLLGIVAGSLVVFSLLRFYKAEGKVKSME
jgi:uncharacterized hydrophobic protein (TIGR00271 family)